MVGATFEIQIVAPFPSMPGEDRAGALVRGTALIMGKAAVMAEIAQIAERETDMV
jgi:hypothetical protein